MFRLGHVRTSGNPTAEPHRHARRRDMWATWLLAIASDAIARSQVAHISRRLACRCGSAVGLPDVRTWPSRNIKNRQHPLLRPALWHGKGEQGAKCQQFLALLPI